MKITKSYLKQVIKEELGRLEEAHGPEGSEYQHFIDPSSVKDTNYGSHQDIDDLENKLTSIKGLGNLKIGRIEGPTWTEVRIAGTMQQEEIVKRYLNKQKIPYTIKGGSIVIDF